MRTLSSVYDPCNEKYVQYHCGVLAFIITVGIPMTLGIAKIPLPGAFLLFSGGFCALFMLARNDNVGKGLLSHLHIHTMTPKNTTNLHEKLKVKPMEVRPPLEHVTSTINYKKNDNTEEPFELVKNVVEHIIISHDDYIDRATRTSLANLHRKLEIITNNLLYPEE
jgi:hypothetical protein